MLPSVFAFLLLTLPLTPAQADALTLALVSTPQPVPQNLPVELGAAIERFWQKEELWGTTGWPWAADRIKTELEWTRERWPNDLPSLSELDRLPTRKEIAANEERIRAMRAIVDQLAETLPPWNADAILDWRCELDACECFCNECRTAMFTENPPIYRRLAIAQIRASLGDEAFFSGRWPTYPYRRIPLTK